MSTTKRNFLRMICLTLLMPCTVGLLAACGKGSTKITFSQPVMQSRNLLEGAEVVRESLRKRERPDARHLLSENAKCWTPVYPGRKPAEGNQDSPNASVELKLAEKITFNTAVIEEVGNQVQYFRLQALVGDTWQTVYQSEKIQTQRLCGFDAVTTDRVRLSIDKFRDGKTAANIKSLRLYNEPKREAADFEAAVYQRLDGDVPTEVLAKGAEYAAQYARYYDVYSTVIVFAAVHWDDDGIIHFGERGEEGFAREVAALKEIIALRTNKEHRVKVIVTTLADGLGGGHLGVNDYMAKHWAFVADQTIDLVEKYDLDGADIDWEYPQNAEDWKVFDKFIERLDDGMKAVRPDAVLSGALSAWGLGMRTDILQRFDQIQYMAYDGMDEDGYQSSLDQAQHGLADFVKNGASLGQINIGIAAYGRPVGGEPFWATWRGLKTANYWDSKYYNIPDGDYQNPNAGVVYDGTFCAPALAGDKTAYALFSGAGGVMVFRLACDKTMDDPNSVARGIENALLRYRG